MSKTKTYAENYDNQAPYPVNIWVVCIFFAKYTTKPTESNKPSKPVITAANTVA
ncbi:MAG: hypothetical protein OXC57_10340 [Rhodobacteraceae bacterium]|nr:hypothetical protein [Paracoccaceae bacterium]